jgi:Uma2 family endonuclease
MMSTAATKPLKRVRWTVKQYLRMGEIGLLGDRRVELINGEVVEMPAQAYPHRLCITRTSRSLLNAFGTNAWVIIQGTLLLPPYGAPDPDFHVFNVPEGTPEDRVPLPILVIEVSDTTYLKDSGPKLRMYARAGVEEYWILNLPEDRLEVYRQPERLPSAVVRWRYGSARSFQRGENVSPLSRPDLTFPVSDLLPP